MSGLKVQRIGPVASVQDRGRPGFLDQGLSQGGAADVVALAEGAALLRQDPGLAALEMGGIGGAFEATGPLSFALTGAPMDATLDGETLTWNASHAMAAGQVLSIGAARAGVYGYLHLSGGIDTDAVLGARAAHMSAGLGRMVQVGDHLPAGREGVGPSGQVLDPDDRFAGGTVRLVESFQSDLFSRTERDRFAATAFRRGSRANRMGVEAVSDGAGFAADGQLNILSEVIVSGDVQMTGEGKPFVLLRECGTTGGYPRIGTVLPCDLSRVAQAPVGAPMRFEWVTMEQGLAAQAAFEQGLKALPGKCRPLVRDPSDIGDLLAYQLISGAVSAAADPFE
jgi:5-oxoprolinase (ATP-hydrolysing) subunit C